MIKIVVFCVLLGVCSGDEFDPRKFDYCKQKCASPPHTACTCNVEGAREMIIDDFVHFRTSMVDLHNAYRNQLARGGEETMHGFPKAANMHVINYDLELEYIANCHAKRIYGDHDKCRSKHGMELNAGQNIYGNSFRMNRDGYDGLFNSTVGSWYGEIQNVVDLSIVDKFRMDNSVKSDPKVSIGHFTQVIWAAVRSIGCARVYIAKNPKRPVWNTIVLCDYAGLKQDGYSGNVGGLPIYKKGKPCSQCPKGEKCNKEYGGKWDALCGASEAIPRRIPYGFEWKIPSETDTTSPDNTILNPTNSVSRIPDFTSHTAKTPDSKTGGTHKIFVNRIFVVVVPVILAFY